jgi:hypothetical protein
MYATLHGHRQIVQLLLEPGADINSVDSRFGAAPTGWAIEYLGEMGGYLAIGLDDLAYAIQSGDTRWVARFLKRFPSLRQASDTKGMPRLCRTCPRRVFKKHCESSPGASFSHNSVGPLHQRDEDCRAAELRTPTLQIDFRDPTGPGTSPSREDGNVFRHHFFA